MRANQFHVRPDNNMWIAERHAGNGEVTWMTDLYTTQSPAIAAIRQLLWTVATQDLGLSPRAFIRLYAGDILFYHHAEYREPDLRDLFELAELDFADEGEHFMARFDLVDPSDGQADVAGLFAGTGIGDVLVFDSEMNDAVGDAEGQS